MAIILVFWKWYYGEAMKNVLNAWRNFIIFALNYFSIPLLLKTLFAPWKRDITRKPRGLDIKKFLDYLAFNLISRGLGFLVRLVTILVGIVFLILVAVAGAIFFAFWLVLPLILLGLLIFAICLI
ncbi:hypothetical protein KKF60_01715 [Patescibacteria group bacterium]|nr:hypothetical protein [Patescibacteria group bacterium]MBU4458598.1 hypothetical protein [Patescibacteria group bacterium]MCG2696355.1 hypothetical protein [Candidatus Portnoybacteria bacterium]